MIDTILACLFAASALLGGILMILLRHPMRVAMALIVTMISLGGIYGILGVHEIAVFQIMIYVSAVMVFMVYAIMLLDVRDSSFVDRFSKLLIPAWSSARCWRARSPGWRSRARGFRPARGATPTSASRPSRPRSSTTTGCTSS
jgi:hypothetical protein